MLSECNTIKLKVNNRKILENLLSIWKPNNMLLNNTWIKRDVKREIRNYFELKENENTKYQDLWGSSKALKQYLGRIVQHWIHIFNIYNVCNIDIMYVCIYIHTYTEREERSQKNYVLFHLKPRKGKAN